MLQIVARKKNKKRFLISRYALLHIKQSYFADNAFRMPQNKIQFSSVLGTFETDSHTEIVTKCNIIKNRKK